MSTVIPIKDDRGLSSTGILRKETGAVRRLTMTEIHTLPESFTIAQTDSPDQVLAVNTGLWVCDFTDEWVEKVTFTIRDGIQKGEDGLFRAAVMPEDWDFSAQCARLGLSVGATRKVVVDHYGRKAYRNDQVWGQETDVGGV
jgi:hypothetical protein